MTGKDSFPDVAPSPAQSNPPATEHGFWWKVWQVAKVAQARLRFIAILAAIGALIASWDTLSNYYEKWTRPLYGAGAVASGEFEYFCPMHPFIVRDTPKEKCPICHMDLSRRQKGTDKAEPLPAGTVSRVQLSPYRVVLAGVQTREVAFVPLVKEVKTVGTIEFNETKERRIAARQKARILKLAVNYTGQMVEKGEELATLDVRYSPELNVTLEDLTRAQKAGNKELEEMARKRLELWDIGEEQIKEFMRTGRVGTKLTIRSPIKGHVIKRYQKEGDYVDEGMPLYDVADLDSVWIEAQVYEADQGMLHEGQTVSATTLSLPNEVFTGKLAFIFPHLDEATRTLTARFELPNPGHKLRPGMYATVRIEIAPKDLNLVGQNAGKEKTDENREHLEQGQVLAIPENAVIDTGSLKVVYRETALNTFEGVIVQLGPRMNGPGTDAQPATYYPVISGLGRGDRVVTNGSFLIDAETRLNPAAGSIYYGGSGGHAGHSSVAIRPSTPPQISDADQKLIDEQRVCPETGNKLGSMGTPFKLMIKNTPVFLCCDGCEDEAKAHETQTLVKVQSLKEQKGKKPGEKK
jgi:multidrug efflux pump subunit AcrA (membrane-fusion protein)